MSQSARLRNPADFRAVYDNGKRFEGRLMTVFVFSKGLEQHRLGITASRKMSLRAVDRNRAKRLLREAFRLCGNELDALKTSFDWVFNARRRIIEAELSAVMEELRRVIAQVTLSESGHDGRADR